MKKRLANKAKSKRGFTLAEALLAVLILLLVSGIVAAGIPTAEHVYEKAVLASNAEVLLSTAISSLRNELGTAKNIAVSDDQTTISYYNGTRGSTSRIYLDTESPNTIMIQRYAKTGELGIDSSSVRLVSKTASTGDLFVTFEKVTYDGSLITFTNLRVNRESGRTGLAERGSFSIRVIAG